MLLKNIASQIVQLGSLVKTTDGSRLISGAAVRWCKDGTWAGGGGTLSVEETDQYKYAPTQAETNCAEWAVAVDHANAVQPLVLAGRTMLASVGDLTYLMGGTLDAGGGGANLAVGFRYFFDEPFPTGHVNSLPTPAPGMAGGVFIAGVNAQTTVTSGFGANSINATSLAVDTIGYSELAATAATKIAAAGGAFLTGGTIDSLDSQTVMHFTDPVLGIANLCRGQLIAIYDTSAGGQGVTAPSVRRIVSSTGTDGGGDATITIDSAPEFTMVAGDTFRVYSAQDVKAKVVEALATDTYAQPGQGAPPATASFVVQVGYLYKALRNKGTQSGNVWNLYADNDTTVDQKASYASDGTTGTRGKIVSGP